MRLKFFYTVVEKWKFMFAKNYVIIDNTEVLALKIKI